MIAEPRCPSCGAERWRALGQHTYRAADLDRRRRPLTAYQRLRLRVLFEVWMPGAGQIELRTLLCGSCGFVTFAPRPSAADLEAKYRFLATQEPDESGAGSGAAIAADRARAERTFATVAPLARRQPARVLDHGGAEGRLLTPFRDAGWACALVDYVEDVLPGVERLGETLADVPSDRRFEVILSSHVLEHLADPAATLRELVGRLAPGGVLFVEVPVDIWGGPPIDRDPVTHVNFFTSLTLEQILSRSGYRVIERAAFTGAYAGVVKDLAVAVATPGDARPRDPAPAIREAERLIRPTPFMRLRRIWRHRVRPRVAARPATVR